jgi:hypothetical protein
LQKGVSIEIVSVLLAHSSIRVTERHYLSVGQGAPGGTRSDGPAGVVTALQARVELRALTGNVADDDRGDGVGRLDIGHLLRKSAVAAQGHNESCSCAITLLQSFTTVL